MNKESNFGGLLGELLGFVMGVVGMIALFKAAQWLIEEGIKSWRTKDSAYRADCVVIPIAGAILGVSLLGLGIAMLLFPSFR